jgi:putative endonuclease
MQEVGGSIPPGSTTLRPMGDDGLKQQYRFEFFAVERSIGSTPFYGAYFLYTFSACYVAVIAAGFPDQEYIGVTADLKRRIPEQNSGRSTHTAEFKPWKLIWYCAFPDKYKALAFEKYLKSHAGRAFAHKRL